MFCTACGTRNAPDANFCKQCGHKLDRTPAPRISEDDFALPESQEDRVKDLLLLAFQKNEVDDTEAALAACSEALAIRPDSTDAHSLMSTLYEKQGEREKAIAAREKVLELNPGSIADREKLEQLRDSTTAITPRKITSSRRPVATTLFDHPAGAAITAVVVMLIVMLIGAWAVWGRSNRVTARSTPPGSVPPAPAAPAPTPQGANPSQNVAAAPFPGWYYPPVPVPSNATPRDNEPRRSHAGPDLSQMQPQGEVPPAPISLPATGQLERDPRFTRRDNNGGSNGSGANGNGSTVHLPDNGLDASEVGPSPIGNAAQGAVQPPVRNPGKIEIIVSPDGARNNSGTGVPRNTAGADTGGQTMDSRQQRDFARQLQIQGQYRRAVNAYIKALDGAGDEAGPIHQQIALCYQRLDEKENAVAQYNAAIAEYRKLLSAGRNADAANRGIQVCEAGIKACQ